MFRYLFGYLFLISKLNFLFLLNIAISNRLFFHFVIILESNDICKEGAKALAEALKFNKNLTCLNIGIFLELFTK